MIEFYINDKEVILPDDFSFTHIENNPEINNEGEFTLDITISLLEPKNIIAFGFINRKNVSEIQTTLSSRLVEDGITTFGSSIISKNTDIDVTFQFIAGNSELNYTTKTDDRKIWELPWGAEAPISYARALESLTNPGYYYEVILDKPLRYITRYFVCAPVQLDTEVVNDFTLNNATYGQTLNINGVYDKIIMQPYILYYINKLPQLLGYSLTYNVLNDDERAKKMFIVNSIDSLNYGDALPDWTISEFIEYIENFFNVSFLVDAKTKTIAIHNFESNLVTKKRICPIIIDSYERNLENESIPIKFGFTKISYELPGTNYFKYQHFSDDILKMCKVLEFANFSAINDYMCENFATGTDEFIIYRDMELTNDYLYLDEINHTNFKLYKKVLLDPLFPGPDGSRHFHLVNKFSSVGTSDDAELTFKIIPASFVFAEIPTKYYYEENSYYNFNLYYQLPQSSNSYSKRENQGVVSAIENGKINIPRLSSLEIAMYAGRVKMVNEYDYHIVNYPMSFVDILPEIGPDITSSKLESWIRDFYKPVATKSLRLKGNDGIVSDYHFESIIDLKKTYTFTIFDSPDVKSSNLFSIDNVDYTPISLERQKSNKQNKTVKGTFYRNI